LTAEAGSMPSALMRSKVANNSPRLSKEKPTWAMPAILSSRSANCGLVADGEPVMLAIEGHKADLAGALMHHAGVEDCRVPAFHLVVFFVGLDDDMGNAVDHRRVRHHPVGFRSVVFGQG
jgi:hypothetical protein